MAEAKTKKKNTKKTNKKTARKSKSPAASKKKNLSIATGFVCKDQGELIQEALDLETELEEALLKDAILTAQVALESLRQDTHGPPWERRRGIRLREKAVKVERAFNRLRALRKGELLPERHPDD